MKLFKIMNAQPMKKIIAASLACVLALVAIPLVIQVFSSSLVAQTETTDKMSKSEFPMGRDCVLCLDPRAASDPVYAANANVLTGLSGPDVMEGKIIADRGQWLVIKTLSRENWVPKDKILFLSFDD